MQSPAPLEPDLSRRRVHKFGGASLSDGARIRRAADRIVERAPDRPIVVVSAVEGVTVQLDQLARDAARGAGDFAPLRVRHRSLLAQLELDAEQLNRHFAELSTVLAAIRKSGELTQAHRDHVLSFGERASARIVAAHLSQRGLRAVPIDAYDLGLITDSNHGRARVLPQSAAYIRSALARFDAIAVITGFVAADADGRLTTLGRNGSDVSAALIGEAIGAREVVFWKEVDGVMSADPKLVPNARRIERLSYEQARELTRHGAGVLHCESIEPLVRSGIPGRVSRVAEPLESGTVIGFEPHGARAVGVACRRGVALVRVARAASTGADWSASLHRCGIEPLCVSEDVSGILVAATSSDELERLLAQRAAEVHVERDLAAVAAVGAGETDLLEHCLLSAGVVVRAAWTDGSSRVFVVAGEHLARAAQVLHGALCEPQPA